MDFLVSTQVAEKVLAVLITQADEDGYVSATGEGVGRRVGVSRASGARALALLAHQGAVDVVRRGSRVGPSIYRIRRELDTELLRTAPVVA